MPLALFIIKELETSAIFVIFICSIWPICLLNTAFWRDGMYAATGIHVARTHEAQPKYQHRLSGILPAAAPTILTGMRYFICIAWLGHRRSRNARWCVPASVHYIWNEWNNLASDQLVVLDPDDRP